MSDRSDQIERAHAGTMKSEANYRLICCDMRDILTDEQRDAFEKMNLAWREYLESATHFYFRMYEGSESPVMINCEIQQDYDGQTGRILGLLARLR